jgi:DNA-binding MarR family transcriptional regulator
MHDRTWVLLERIGAVVRAEARAAGMEHGLQPVQLQALSYVARCNRYSDTPASLAEYLGVTKGTASQTLGVLERQGLVAKRADAKDRRLVRLELTRAGRSVVERIVPPPSLRGMSASSKRLESVLEDLLRALQRANGGRAFGVCRTCRHFQRGREGDHRCGLTEEPLSTDDSTRICREHEIAEAG